MVIVSTSIIINHAAISLISGVRLAGFTPASR